MRAPCLASAALLAGCPVLPGSLDLSDEPVEAAMIATLDQLEATYAFTEHKGLDWDAVRADLVPRARAADTPESADDALRHLLPYLPDAHVQLFARDPERDLCPEARESFGLALAELDDGRFVVARSDGPALQPGDEVLTWDGAPIEQAVDDAPLRCFPIGAATHARIRQARLRLLTRGRSGSSATLEVRRDGVDHVVTVEASPDTADIRAALGVELPETLVSHDVLPSGMGYIAVGWEETYLAETRFQAALARLRHAPGLVVDLRGNDGGMDEPAAKIAGMFSTRRFFYETITFLNNRTLEQEVIATIWVEPGEIVWRRPTAVLVDANTVSSGEGLAFLLSKMPQVEIFGFEGTAASFGSTGNKIRLPGGFTLTYPAGRSLDAAGRIQLDSDETLQGGVLPTRRVPWTQSNVLRHHAGEDVVLEVAVAWLEEVTP